MSEYPWITFKADLNKVPYTAWIQIGECVSKCEHISKIPLQPETAKEMHKVYLAKGVLATTAIEGNTLTEEEVKLRIENKLILPPSREYLGQEIGNILQLCNEIMGDLQCNKPFKIKTEEIKRFNMVILQKVPHEEHVVPGEYRQYPVGVGSYKAVDHKDIPELVEHLCSWLNSDDFIINDKMPVLNSIIKAIIAHLYIAWIHPFGDGNGRTARILEFAILLNSGIPSPAVHLLSNHYNLTRNEYYIQLDLASKKNDIYSFMSYAVQGFRDGLIEQLKYIFSQIYDASWENYVHHVFKEYDHSEHTTKRRRILALEISKHTSPVPLDNMIILSQKTIELYKDKGIMTLRRDLNELTRLDLVGQGEKGYIAKKEKLLTFLPPCVKAD